MARDDVEVRLNAVMPAGVQVAASATDKAPLPPRLEASTWQVTWPDAPPGLAAAVAAFMAADEVVVDRRSKGGVKQQDVRPAVVSMAATDVLTMTLLQGEPLIRPSDVLTGLGGEARPSLYRVAQGRLSDLGYAAWARTSAAAAVSPSDS